ncbi:MAG: response regulator [Patescibacteria group bacterium]|jgi:DNA-binding response OmpR family regulator
MPELKYKVALIEDEPDLAEIYHLKMQMEGIDATIIGDSTKALEELKRLKPDLVLLDIMMPELDGWTLFDQIKKDSELSKLKVYIWSNLTQKKDKDRAAGLKVNGYLVKSDFTPGTLSQKVKELIKK